jgi:hypothetical protein
LGGIEVKVGWYELAAFITIMVVFAALFAAGWLLG